MNNPTGKVIIGTFFKDLTSAKKFIRKRPKVCYGILECGLGCLVVNKNQLIKAGAWDEKS